MTTPLYLIDTSALHDAYPEALWIDLLKTDEYRRFMQNPELIREEIEYKKPAFVVIDEIQKIPALLNEVHWLRENRGVHFALCGSSARKIRKGTTNLLGGRGIHKDEIAAEGLVRNLPGYSQFLNMAALSDGEMVNYTTIARDTGVSSQTIRGYFGILEDTLLGRFLPAYRLRPKRRIVAAPKFYFHDVGIVNFLARRGRLMAGSELYGKAFENWVFHELYLYNMYRERYAEFFFWRLSGGTEVDFLVNHIDCAIECKATQKIQSGHLKGLRQLGIEHPEVKRRIIVSLDQKNRRTEDGIDIVSYHEFLRLLWNGELF